MCLTVGAGFLCRGILSFFRDGYEARDCAPWHGGQEFGEKGEGPTMREDGGICFVGCRLPVPVGTRLSGQGFEKPLAAFPHIPVGGIKIPCVPRVGYVPVLSGKFQQPVKFSRWVARGQPV